MNRRHFLRNGLWVVAPAIFIQRRMLAQTVGQSIIGRSSIGAGGSGGGGGPNVWYDLQASPGNASDGTNSTTLFWSALAPTLGGSCTKLRIWCVSGSAGNVKMGLWNNDKSIITGANGSAAVGANGAYTEVTLGTPATVVGGTTYLIAWETDSAAPLWGYDNTTGTLQFNNSGTYTYANFPNGSLPADNPVANRNHCIGMFVA